MNVFKRFLHWFAGGDAAVRAAAPAEPPKVRKPISHQAVASIAPPAPRADAPRIEPYKPPVGVLPDGVGLAMDFAPGFADYDAMNGYIGGWENAAFRGYQYLAIKAQQAEFRKITGTLATESTRKWIRLTSKGKGNKSATINTLEDALKRFKVRALFRRMSELDGFYGRGQIYVDVKTPGGAAAVGPELNTMLIRDPAKIKKGSLLGFKAVEPMWTYPGMFDATNPLAQNFYRPQVWYVMGKTVHYTRLLTMISRPVPDMLKASYNFGGLSMTQMAEPYVNNWLRTRDSVSDLLHSYSLTGLATDLSATLTEGDAGGQLDMRMQLFNRARDNRGMMLINKDEEEIFQFNVPLSGLDKLQAQAQEQMSSVSSIPLVKLLGVTPSGLNASSDGEVRVFYDYVHSYQEDFYRDALKQVLDIIQLSELGAIDDDISFEFVQLWQSDGLEAAQIRKSDADTDAVLLETGAISPAEIRQRLIEDPDNVYHNLEAVGDVSDEYADPNADPALPAANDPKSGLPPISTPKAKGA